MYKSPIEKIYGDFRTQMVQEDEKMVINAVRNVGVNVDKEELIKALQYDRNQYTKGYEDGKNEVLNKIRAEIEQEYKVESEHPYGQGLRWALEIIDKYSKEQKE